MFNVTKIIKMRLLSTFVVFALFCCVSCKNNVKSLTESMGQEVIEIGTPVKELPPELEEEPSAEPDEDEKPTSIAATIMPVTKKEAKKTTVETRRKSKEIEVNEEEDARIEKELSEIYKDNADYKDNSDDPKTQTNVTDKPGLRAGSNFKFQPDLNNKREVERFRTSIDDISCAKSVTRLDDRDRPQDTDKKQAGNGAARVTVTGIFWIVSTLLVYSLC